MKRVILGKTGLEAYQLGFGGIPIQTVDEEKAVETVRHAVEKGVDFIDTSRAYTTSETRIGKALKLAGKKVILATKSHCKTADAVRKDVEISLKELQVDYIDIYQCHFVRNPDDYRQVVSPGGAREGLLKARDEGLIGHVGLTSHSLDLLVKVIEDELFETIMVCFSFLEPAALDRVIPAAQEKNIGIIAMKPFSGGAIENALLALRYVLSRPDILIIPGVESPELFDRNWQIFQEGQALSVSDREEIERIRQAHDKIFCRRCDYCQPCTQEIPIQIVMGFKYLVKRMGRGIFEHPLFSSVIQKARTCTECGACVPRCPYELPIPELIKEHMRWVDSVL